MTILKTYKATIVATNSSYLHTVLVVAENETLADALLCEAMKERVEYTSPLKELVINLSKPNVITHVGWGHNNND